MNLRKLSKLSKRVLAVLYDFEKSGAVEFLDRPATVEDLSHKLGDKDTEEDVKEAVQNLVVIDLLSHDDNAANGGSVMLTDKGRDLIKENYSELSDLLRSIERGKSKLSRGASV